MARSSWKGPFVHPSVFKKAIKAKEENRLTPIQTWSRSSTILPQFVGLSFRVYNGRKFILVSVTEEMVGHKLGEFSHTRTFYGHGADRKAKRKA
jgi:small subunit ribosomal protein S19